MNENWRGSEVMAPFGRDGRWLRSNVFDPSEMESKRAIIQTSICMSCYYVFTAVDPDDDAEPPTGWLDCQPRFMTGFPITPKYFPNRVYAVPKDDLLNMLKHFQVGSSGSLSTYNDLLDRIRKIEEVVSLNMIDIGPSDLVMVFLSYISMSQALQIQEAFPYETMNHTMGTDAYISDWNPSQEPCPLAGCIHRDQKLHLWWD